MKKFMALTLTLILPLATMAQGGPKVDGTMMHLSNMKYGSYKMGAKNDKKDYSLVPEKNPAFSLILSLMLTGGGQFYNEQNAKGAVMLGSSVVGVALLIVGLWDEGTGPDYDSSTDELGYTIVLGTKI